MLPSDTMNSNSLRSHSESYTTLLENDMEPATTNASNSKDPLEVVGYYPGRPHKNPWVDRLFGIFCVKFSNRALPIMHKDYAKRKNSEILEIGDNPSSWPSPWILPVYVISNEQVTDKHPVTKIAKCTIDTGNMQGNIVSREFAEKVLGFPPSSFEKLTEEEEKGGTGITGEPHIPQGAIYLTWYHKNSTRVFRDMRFLISPAHHCDLIIGARSIQKDKILDVPCLTVVKPSQNPTLYTPPPHQDKALKDLEIINNEVWEKWDDRKNKKTELGNKATAKHDKDIEQSITEVDIVGWLIIVYGIAITNKEGGNPEKHSDAVDIWKEIDIHWDEMRPKLRDKLEKPYYLMLTEKLNLDDNRHSFGSGKSTGLELL